MESHGGTPQENGIIKLIIDIFSVGKEESISRCMQMYEQMYAADDIEISSQFTPISYKNGY
ncbi:hypothetical protein ACLOJK_038036 [Asimina triloba]